MAITDQSMERNYTNGARLLLTLHALTKTANELHEVMKEIRAENKINDIYNRNNGIDNLSESDENTLKKNLNKLSDEEIKGDVSVRLVKASSSEDVANRLKQADIGFVQLSNTQNGMTVFLYSSLDENIVSRELAYLEKEKASKVIVEPKTLEQMNTSRKDSVISTISGLSDYETKLFAEAAARRQATISINNNEKNNNVISYMSAESSKMDKAISDVALEKSGKTGEQQEVDYGNYVSKIDELSKMCINGNTFYIASKERPNSYIEVNENGFSNIKTSGMIVRAVSSEEVQLDDAYGIGKLATQMTAYNNPVFLTQEEFNDIENRQNIVEEKTNLVPQEYDLSSRIKSIAYTANDIGYQFSSLNDLQSDSFKENIIKSKLPDYLKDRTLAKIQIISNDQKNQDVYNNFIHDYANNMNAFNRLRSIEPELQNDEQNRDDYVFDAFENDELVNEDNTLESKNKSDDLE